MAWLLKTNKKGQYKFFSTVVDRYLTDWMDREEAIRYIIDDRFHKCLDDLDHERENFPKGWTDKDTRKLIK